MFSVVGVGSFAFHATLSYTAQLADELPMIYAASWCLLILFDNTSGFDLASSPSSITWLASVSTFDVLFTLA